MSDVEKAAIVPHTKTKGIDICSGYGEFVFIIRSDLHCYMKCDSHLDYESDYLHLQKFEISPLHPACSGGDHYVISPNGYNIIKDDYFFTVGHLSAPKHIPIKKEKLSSPCMDGDNYLNDGTNFIIVKGTKYLVVSDLTSSNVLSSGTLHSSYQNALYYYGNGGLLSVIIESELGVIFTHTENLGVSGSSWLVYPDVIDFLPGGLSIGFGTSTPRWVILKAFTNLTKKAALTWKDTVTKTVGYNKSQFSSLEKNWSVSTEVSMGTSFSIGFLVQASVKMQFSLSTSFGGSSVQTHQEDWNEAYTTSEEISLTVEPGESVYIWQFRMGLKGSNDILFCRDLLMTDSPNPPTSIPLPPM